jgi:hypothetical protein
MAPPGKQPERSGNVETHINGRASTQSHGVESRMAGPV